ncbi:MAG: bifunctional riboflavin kinase/FAD synthetase [Hyphomicrobiales bacterium]|nr:bifunctional riboflavin kinase/FAD synthetase [Hyphomicrobiales bacterium]
MEVFNGWRGVPDHLRGASLAIGKFDGVHRGHRAVLELAKQSTRPGLLTGAMVFDPHPRKFFQPDKALFELTPLPHKLELLADCGIDLVAVLPFDRELASLGAEHFVQDVLVDGFGISHAATGYNFFFGKNRQGTPDTLRELGVKYGFGVSVASAVGASGEIFSSSRIRELLAEGDVAAASEILGNLWQVEGVVESGAGRGSVLGFPTANIRLAEGQLLRHGIYAVRVGVNGNWYNGAAYLGTRPTFDSGPSLLETFLFNFENNLYGQVIKIEFVDFVRADAKFRSGTDLVAQMQKDCAKAKIILEKYSVEQRS